MSSRTALAAVLMVAGMVHAQTTPPTITLSNFTEESVITLDQLTSPDAPALPDDLVNSVQAGQAELHQMLSYKAAPSTLSVSLVALPAGSPVPTPASASGNLVYLYTVNVKSITATEGAAALNGVIISSQGASGMVAGGLMTVTAGYTLLGANPAGGATASFTSLDVSVAGVGSLAAKSGMGVLKLGGGALLPVAVAGPKGITVSTPSFSLSGQKSTDPSGGKLTYQWAVIPAAGQNATLTGATTATPMVTIADDGTGSAFGLYTFQLTITNPSGLAAIDTVTIDYESGQ